MEFIQCVKNSYWIQNSEPASPDKSVPSLLIAYWLEFSAAYKNAGHEYSNLNGLHIWFVHQYLIAHQKYDKYQDIRTYLSLCLSS